MREGEVYVVRVYRRDAGGVSGVVEDVLRQTSAAFRSVEGLAELILLQPPESGKGRDRDEDRP